MPLLIPIIKILHNNLHILIDTTGGDGLHYNNIPKRLYFCINYLTLFILGIFISLSFDPLLKIWLDK